MIPAPMILLRCRWLLCRCVSSVVAAPPLLQVARPVCQPPSTFLIELGSEEPQQIVKNPNISQSKGRPVFTKKSTIMKRGIEISQEDGSIQCKGCGEVNSGHDIRNCPDPWMSRAGLKPNKTKSLKRRATTHVSNTDPGFGISSPAKCTRSKTTYVTMMDS